MSRLQTYDLTESGYKKYVNLSDVKSDLNTTMTIFDNLFKKTLLRKNFSTKYKRVTYDIISVGQEYTYWSILGTFTKPELADTSYDIELNKFMISVGLANSKMKYHQIELNLNEVGEVSIVSKDYYYITDDIITESNIDKFYAKYDKLTSVKSKLNQINKFEQVSIDDIKDDISHCYTKLDIIRKKYKYLNRLYSSRNIDIILDEYGVYGGTHLLGLFGDPDLSIDEYNVMMDEYVKIDISNFIKDIENICSKYHCFYFEYYDEALDVYIDAKKLYATVFK